MHTQLSSGTREPSPMPYLNVCSPETQDLLIYCRFFCYETKPDFGVFVKARLKPVSSATENSQNNKISLSAILYTILLCLCC